MMNFAKPITMMLSAAVLSATSTAVAREPTPLSAAVQPYVDRTELAGAVMLVADKDAVLATEAVGWANIEDKKPMRPDAVFWIASQSKPITATALMMLVDEGNVSLDDPIAKHLPEFENQMVIAEKTDDSVTLRVPKRPVTVRDVLSHCSGFPFRSALEEPTLDLLPLSARVRSYAMTPLDAEPGTNYRYSNAGINTAARIIEVVAGVPFEEFLDERLFRPLGMVDTTFWPGEKQAARIAQSYQPGPDKSGLAPLDIDQLYYPLTDRVKRFPVPAGGLFSTAQDVARFYRMIVNGGQLDGRRYVSEGAVAQMTRKQTPDAIKNGYGLGFKVRPGSYGHGGAYSTGTTVESESDLILIWLVQHAGFPGKGKESQETFRRAAIEAF